MDIIRPDEGHRHIRASGTRDDNLDRFGISPKSVACIRSPTVIDVMTYFGALKGLTRAERAAAQSSGSQGSTCPRWSRGGSTVSKGMSQKVQIAATLMSEPEVCIMDEPTTGSIPSTCGSFRTMLIERRKARTTMFSTHQMSHAEALCDRVALIHRGRLTGLWPGGHRQAAVFASRFVYASGRCPPRHKPPSGTGTRRCMAHSDSIRCRACRPSSVARRCGHRGA